MAANGYAVWLVADVGNSVRLAEPSAYGSREHTGNVLCYLGVKCAQDLLFKVKV